MTGTVRALAPRPSTWLGLAVLALPLGSSSGPTAALVTPSDALLMVAVLTAGLAILRGERLDIVRSLPAVGFLALGLVTAVVAVLAADARLGLVGAVRSTELFLLVPVSVMVALQSRWDCYAMLGAVVALALVEGTVGIVQRVTHTGASIDGENVRAVGTFGAYNIAALASLSAFGLLVGLAYGLAARRLRWIGFAVAAYLALPLTFALSRGAWLATATGAFIVVTRGRPGRMLVGIATAAIVGAIIVPPLVASGSDLGQRVQSLATADAEPDQSVKDRLALWSAARHMAIDHPVIGAGPRSFPAHRDAYANLTLLGSSDIADSSGFRQVALDSPHDFYLLIASEQGLLSLTAYASVLAMLLLRGLVRVARRTTSLATALALAGTGLLGYQLVDMVAGDLGGPGSVMVALILGLAGWSATDHGLSHRRPGHRRRAADPTAAAPRTAGPAIAPAAPMSAS